MISDGASPLGGTVTFAGVRADNRNAATQDVVCDLSHRSLIRVSGQDAAAFLQGQFSNDVRLVDAAHSQLSAYNSPKGRMLAVLRVLRYRDDFLLQVPGVLAADLVRRLRMYVLRSKVTLDIVDAAWQCVGLAGPDSIEKLRNVTASWPSAIDECVADNRVVVVRVPGAQPRFELLASMDAAPEIWRALRAAGCIPCGAAAWSWFDIVAGVPVVLPATVDAFVPQMANLDALNGISFTKGCYTGQEIVARMQYLGRLKQRMYLAHVDGDIVPAPGESLFAPDFGEQAAGTVVDAQPAPDGGCDLLAVAQIASVERDEVHLARRDGPRLTFRPLPYRVAASGDAAAS
jgi:folate-binding protein YgfZ